MRDQTITLHPEVRKKTARRTAQFRDWFSALRDSVLRTTVAARIERVQMALYGDVKAVGQGVCELRIHIGPGFRVYFSETLDDSIVLLLVGGDKSSQRRDIGKAQTLLADLKRQRDTRAQEPASIVTALSTEQGK